MSKQKKKAEVTVNSDGKRDEDALIETQVQPDGVQSVKQPEVIDVAEISKCVGRYTNLWRNESKQIAKIISTSDEEITYEMVTGPDKGKKYRAKYFAKSIKVFDDDNLILATAE